MVPCVLGLKVAFLRALEPDDLFLHASWTFFVSFFIADSRMQRSSPRWQLEDRNCQAIHVKNLHQCSLT